MTTTKSPIEWTEHTWNPVTGCDRVSPGCDHCYALTMSARLKAMGNPRYQNDGTRKTSGPGFGVTLHPDKLDEPLRRKKPTVYFVNSMSDLFHPDVPPEFIEQVFAVMALASSHTFQILTKRPRRMRDLLSTEEFWKAVVYWTGQRFGHVKSLGFKLPPPNVWLGTSVENQEWADKRIPLLLKTPAAVRFLSCEPLLGPVDLRQKGCPVQRWDGPYRYRCSLGGDGTVCSIHGEFTPAVPADLHWVIVGGESGPGARPMHPDWARSLRDQCVAAGVPFFFKQWGAWAPDGVVKELVPPAAGLSDQEWLSTHMRAVGKKRAGRELDGRTWDEMPEVVSA